MYNFIRFYNQNRKKIIKIIIIIVFIIIIIQLLNLISKNKVLNNQNNKEVNNNNNSNNNIINSLASSKSAISGESINDTKLKSDVDVIDDFFNYCNSGKIDLAYNMLTDECKEEMFPTEEYFNENYYSKIFNNSVKTHLVENWINNIYKVEINEDFLSTGKVAKDNTIVDYVTVKEKNGEYKININNYIGRSYLNIETEKNNVNIKVLREDAYINYTTYVFEILNNSGRIIMLDDLNNLDTMYLVDGNKMKYSAYTHEIAQNSLRVYDSEKKQFKIKYYSKYGATKNIKSIIFSKLILDYEKYETIQNKAQYDGFFNFEIKL